MTEDQLARKLSQAYLAAPNRDKALHVMLFAIKYANALQGRNAHYICELAEIPKWGPQINLGRKLADHVTIK